MTVKWLDIFISTIYIGLGLLNIVHCLRFTVEPQDQIVALGSSLWWDCVATDVDTISYRWSLDGNSLPIHGNLVVFGNGTLHIRKISADDIGIYVCTAETSSGQILSSREANLQLAYIDPSFTLNPQSQTVRLGDEVLLACKIGSLPPANITWLLNGEVVTLGTATQTQNGESTLLISPIMYYGAGEYKCQGTNPLLQVYRYSLGAKLVVRGTPVFLASLEPVSVPRGFNATFNCYFHGNPEPSLTWFIHITDENGQVSTAELFNSLEKYTILPNGTLIVHDVTSADQAFYTCSVSNIFGQMSGSAELRVTGEATLPEFSVRPMNVTVKAGDDVRVQCEASGNPAPDIVFIKDENVLQQTDSIKVDTGQLTIVDIETTQSGWYQCVAENPVGAVNSSFYIDVQVIPYFTIVPVDVTSVVGHTVVLDCQSEGNPTPSIAWSTPQYGEVNRDNSPSSVTVYSNGTLVVSSTTIRDDGVYTCTARNVVGYKQASVTVKIETSPEFTVLPVSQSVNKGGIVFFHCQSSGIPTPTFVWSKDGEGVIQSSSYRQIYLNHTLVIRSVSQSDAGIYRCTASNRHNSILAVATLTVTVPPIFLVPPRNQTVYMDSRVELQCESTGSPVPTQSWRRNGRSVFTEDNIFMTSDGSLLIIDGIQEGQYGEYTCVATNLVGTSSASAWIVQHDVPVMTTYPQNTTVNQSDTVTLQCRGQAKTETPSVVWYRENSREITTIKVNERVMVSGDGDLTIKNVFGGDEGWYKCVWSNSAGTVSAQLYINVYVLPRILHTNNPQTTVHQSSVILTCQSTGDPPPSLEWFNPSGRKITASSSFLIGSDTLEIVSANQNVDAGDWICQSCNIVGCVDDVIHLDVDGLPLIERFHGYKTGTTIQLECKVKGQPFPVVTFTSQGQPVTNAMKGHVLQNNVLRVQETSVRTEYICSASNKYGRDSATLTVPGHPTVPSVVSIGSTWVTLQWISQYNNSDLPLTNFQVQMTSNGGRTWQNTPIINTQISNSGGNVTNTQPYTAYNFRIASGNILGMGPYSDMSVMVQTLPDAPSPLTNLAALHIDDGIVLFTWSHSQFMNGDRDDVAYVYTVTKDDKAYMSDTIYSNGTLQVELDDTEASGLYEFSVKAVNIKIDQSSAPVSLTLDLRVPALQTQTQMSGSSKLIVILAGVLGGILLICVIIFVAIRVRRRKKTESLSFIKPRLSLDQFYMENTKQLYRSESRLSMKRSRSGNSFYSFTHDDSFHGNGSSVRDISGLSPSKRKSDGDVLLVAKNPLYKDSTMDESTPSHRVHSSEPLLFDSLQQSCGQNEIEIPSADMMSSQSTGSAPNSVHSGKTGSHLAATEDSNKKEPLTPLSVRNLEEDISEIYNSMGAAEKTDAYHSLEHVYASIHSDGQSSRSKDFSLSSNNSTLSSNPNQPKPPIRVLSPDKLRYSPPDAGSFDMALKRSPRSLSPRHSRSTSPAQTSLPKPPTEVVSVEKLCTTKVTKSQVTDSHESNQHQDTDTVTSDQWEDINETNSTADNNETVINCVDSVVNGTVKCSEETNNELIANDDDTDNTDNCTTHSDSITDSEDHNDIGELTNKTSNKVLPVSEGAGEFLLVVKETKKDPWRAKIDDDFLTDEQIKEEVTSAELY